VTAARNQAFAAAGAARRNPAGAAPVAALDAAEGILGGALGRLMAVVEAYPDLKADQNMRELSEELTSTENRVGFARQAYNCPAVASCPDDQRGRGAIFGTLWGQQERTKWRFQQTKTTKSAATW
jgi:LemA protein